MTNMSKKAIVSSTLAAITMIHADSMSLHIGFGGFTSFVNNSLNVKFPLKAVDMNEEEKKKASADKVAKDKQIEEILKKIIVQGTNLNQTKLDANYKPDSTNGKPITELFSNITDNKLPTSGIFSPTTEMSLSDAFNQDKTYDATAMGIQANIPDLQSVLNAIHNALNTAASTTDVTADPSTVNEVVTRFNNALQKIQNTSNPAIKAAVKDIKKMENVMGSDEATKNVEAIDFAFISTGTDNITQHNFVDTKQEFKNYALTNDQKAELQTVLKLQQEVKNATSSKKHTYLISRLVDNTATAVKGLDANGQETALKVLGQDFSDLNKTDTANFNIEFEGATPVIGFPSGIVGFADMFFMKLSGIKCGVRLQMFGQISGQKSKGVDKDADTQNELFYLTMGKQSLFLGPCLAYTISPGYDLYFGVGAVGRLVSLSMEKTKNSRLQSAKSFDKIEDSVMNLGGGGMIGMRIAIYGIQFFGEVNGDYGALIGVNDYAQQDKFNTTFQEAILGSTGVRAAFGVSFQVM